MKSVRAAHVGNVISFHAKRNRNRIVKRYKGKGKQKIYGKYQSKTYEAKYKIAKEEFTHTHTQSHLLTYLCGHKRLSCIYVGQICFRLSANKVYD